MLLTPGLTVVHPHHGPATVVARTSRRVAGRDVEYVELLVTERRLTLLIPADKADEIGIREVATQGHLDSLVGVLCEPTVDEERTWSRRFKANSERVATGDPHVIAAVVRDLVRRDEAGVLSPAERLQLKDAARPLIAEIALAVGSTDEHAWEVVRTISVEASTRVLDELTEHAAAA
ncbi:MAG: CarD family transcriptional regulator [Dermatophilus congolensis]|nr:CarD family transcriptional regulator [Dermatophilus congolensis]